MTRDELMQTVNNIREDLKADFGNMGDDSFYFEIARSVLREDKELATAISEHTSATDIEGWLAMQL